MHAGNTHSEDDRLPLRKRVIREGLDVVVVQIREVLRERTRETISLPVGAVHDREDIGVSPEASGVGVLLYLLRMVSSIGRHQENIDTYNDDGTLRDSDKRPRLRRVKLVKPGHVLTGVGVAPR